MKKLFLWCTFIFFGISAFCQQSDSVTNINDVTIQASRIQIPFSKQNRNINIISKEDIKKLPVKSVNELLSYISGVDVRQRGPNGSQADIGIDGGGFDQTLVLLNGVKMSDPQTGHNMMNIPVPLAAVERIEILKGASARLYGINALMGAINIVTKAPVSERIEANAYGGSSFKKDDSTGNTYLNYGVQAVGAYGNETIGNQIAIGYDGGSGYRYNTAYDNYKILYTGKITPSDNVTINALGGYVNNQFGANLFYAAPSDKEATEKVQVAVGNVGADIKLNNLVLNPQLSYRYGKDDYIYIRQKPEVYHNIHETNIIDASLNGAYTTAIGVLGMGFNYRNESINSNNLGKDKRDNVGAFVEFHFPLGKQVDANIGAYANYNSIFGFKVYPGIDIGWQANKNVRIYANAGTGQRIPTFTDLYYKGFTNIGNPDLKPEWATTTELGIKYFRNKLRLSGSVFYRNGINFIDWVRADTSMPWQPQNYTTINTTGINVDVAYTFSLGSQATLNLYGGYTYLNPVVGKPKNDADNHLLSQYTINSLQHQLVLRADITIYNSLNISLANRFAKRLNTNTIVGYKVASYNILDARVSYTFQKFMLYADATNLFGVEYIEASAAPMPGRWMTLGLKYAL